MSIAETNLLQRVMTTALEWFLIFLMILLTVVVVTAVLFRIAGDSLSWYDEVAAVLLSWVTYYGACLAALERKHIGVDSVLLMLPSKFRLIGVVVAECFVIGFFILMAWAGYQVVAILDGETLVSLTWVSVQFTQSVIPVTAIIFIVCELLSVPGYWRAVASGQSLNDH
ncbi:MAG: TRAP transporter small permease subunit [Proteobacteria bacterium]|nr:TRAP transporter small permease subunit [Pseudomonadota bacterium]MDA0959857.1 TRAP transporter small permease subunit [Pseudomonadota bacterium]MDA1152001.1 TRAP transporter small permease subunit [Pseudomonadota bacterium]